MKIDKSKLTGASSDNSFASLMGGDKNIVVDFPIKDLDPMEEQPFRVVHNEQMDALIESIKLIGVVEPIVITEEKGKYKILSGHRRTYASKLAGKETVPALIRSVTSGEENAIVPDTNLPVRNEFLPSELAKAYKMQQKGYQELNAHSVRTTAQIAEKNGVSKRMIQYYLKLNDLIPELLATVDKGVINVKAGAVLADLPEDDQENLYDFIRDRGVKKIDETTAVLIIHTFKTGFPLTISYWESLFFPKKQDDLKYDSYIVDQSCIANTYSAINDIYQSKLLKATMVLKKEQYAKLQAAQDKINKQLEVIQKILESN